MKLGRAIELAPRQTDRWNACRRRGMWLRVREARLNGAFLHASGKRRRRQRSNRPEKKAGCDKSGHDKGLPYMTSAVGWGRGVPKKQTKGTKSADFCT